MSPRRESGEDNVYATVKKGKKKKKRTAADDRDDETNVGLSLTDSDRSTKSKRSNSPRNSHSREDTNEKGDSTPRRKKRKKKELASELPSPRSLPQKSSEETLSSVVGPHRKLTFSSDTNGNVSNFVRTVTFVFTLIALKNLRHGTRTHDYLLFINDMPNEMNCNIELFADDAKIFKTVDNEEVHQDLAKDLDNLEKWARLHGR